MEKKKLIEVRDLAYDYGRGPLLHDLSFTLYAGDFVGLIGGNGAGKSTLLRLLLGLLKPQRGAIRLMGTEIAHFRAWQKLAYVPQRVSAFNSAFPIDVEELVGLPLKEGLNPFGARARKRAAAVAAALATVGMEGFTRRRLGQLSGGEAQRVFIAKALVAEPELLILDEPTVGVDQAAEHAVYELLSRLNRERGLAIIWVSHDIAAISAHTRRLFCLGAQGFFEHHYDEGGREIDLRSLYAHEVRGHRHSEHPCAKGDCGHV